MLRKIAAGMGALILVILVVPSFLSAKFAMSRSIEIHAPVSKIYAGLLDLNVYNKWNPFPEGDPTNQTTVAGVGVGSSLTWKGDKTGEGKMTIVGADADKKIDVKMDFYSPLAGEGMVSWLTMAKSDSVTEMVWTYEQNLPYLNRYFGLIMDGMMGKHFEKGLLNYKKMVENAD